MKRHGFIGIVTTLVLITFALGLAQAQTNAPITAQLDRQALTTDEMLTLVVTIQSPGGTMPEPQMPVLDGFNVVGATTSSQMSIINGVVSAQAYYVFRLRPYQTGTLTIPAIGVDINGQMYFSDPLTVQVTQGALQSQPQVQPPGGGQQQPPGGSANPDALPAGSSAQNGRLFVEAVVDNSTPYVGEQVLYHFRFYQAVVPGGQPSYEGPQFTGFWNNRQPDQTQYQALLNGQQYLVTELTNVLFPTGSGEVTIEPARLTIAGSVFGPDYVLETEPVVVNTQPLPEGAPDDFSGAVGQYAISAITDTPEVTAANGSVTLRVTLSGVGNIEALPDPVFPDMPGWREFDSETSTNSDFANGSFGGSRVYERVLVPTEEGALTIPPVSYTYFDPTSEQYVTVSSDPILITVAPGAADAPVVAATQAAPAVQQPEPEPTAAPVEQPETGLRPLRPAPDVLTTEKPLTEQPMFWALWLLPLAALVGEFLWARYDRHVHVNADQIRASRALKRARKALSQARRSSADAGSAAAKILMGYITDKVHQPVTGMTRSALARTLEARGVAPELVQRVDACLVRTEASRFSPDRDDQNKALLDMTERVIKDLEKEFVA